MRINEINTIKLNSSKNVRTTKLCFKEKNINNINSNEDKAMK